MLSQLFQEPWPDKDGYILFENSVTPDQLASSETEAV